MSQISVKRFSSPDEVRPFVGKGHAELLGFDRWAVGRAVFEPGFRWSTHVKPIAGTASCEASHLAYIVSGRMHIRMNDGEEGEAGPGDVVLVPPGHDAWTVGDEECVMLDFSGMGSFARPGPGRVATEPVSAIPAP